jgi:hypothetical protein
MALAFGESRFQPKDLSQGGHIPMLRDLEHPGAVRVLVLFVGFVVAAVVVASRSPSSILSELHTIQTFLH